MKDHNNKFNRRRFLKKSGAFAMSASLLNSSLNAEENSKKTRVPRRKLGKSGIEVSTLALGGDINFLDNQIILRKAFQDGVTYWDSARSYGGGGNSELGIGKFL